MSFRKIAFFALLVHVSVACVTTAVKKQVDEFTGETFYASDYFPLYKNKNAPEKSPADDLPVDPLLPVKIQFKKVISKDAKTTSYNAVIRVQDTPIVYNFGGKDSLQFKVNEKVNKISSDKRSAPTRVSNVSIVIPGRGQPGYSSVQSMEYMEYTKIPESLMQQIIASGGATVRIVSDHGPINGFLRGNVLVALQNLVNAKNDVK